MKQIIKLFLVFSKIGVMTFGGGYAMLPMIQKEIVEKYHWATDEEVVDYYAVGQCTPGVIAVNTATFIGHKIGGAAGAVSATLGVITPSILIITCIAAFIQGYAHIPAVQYAFSGITAAVGVLIINAVVKLWKSGIRNLVSGLIFAAAFLAHVVFQVSSIWIVVVAVLGGVAWEFSKRFRKKVGP